MLLIRYAVLSRSLLDSCLRVSFVFLWTVLFLFVQLGRPEVSVQVSSPRSRGTDNVIQVPLQADMTVLDALIAATRTYIERNGAKEKMIPFNVQLDWDPSLDCFTIVKALGLHSRRRATWFITLSNGSNQVNINAILVAQSIKEAVTTNDYRHRLPKMEKLYGNFHWLCTLKSLIITLYVKFKVWTKQYSTSSDLDYWTWQKS